MKTLVIIIPSDNPIILDNEMPTSLYSRIQSYCSLMEKEGEKLQNILKTFFTPPCYGFRFQLAITASYSPHLNSLLRSPSLLPPQAPDFPDWHQKWPGKEDNDEGYSTWTWGRGQQKWPWGYCPSKPLATCFLLWHFASSNCRHHWVAWSWCYWVQNLNAISVISSPALIQNGEATSHMTNVTACMPRLWRCPWKDPCLFSWQQAVMHC